jgi:hypothetical protein
MPLSITQELLKEHEQRIRGRAARNKRPLWDELADFVTESAWPIRHVINLADALGVEVPDVDAVNLFHSPALNEVFNRSFGPQVQRTSDAIWEHLE